MSIDLIVAAVIAGIVGIVALFRIRDSYGKEAELSWSTAAFVWGFYALYFAFSTAVSARSIWPLPLPQAPSLIIGVALVIVGLLIGIAGAATFRSVRRVAGVDMSELVTTGIYRWSRNPQNVGCGIALLGIALSGRSGLSLALAVAFIAVYRLYIPTEERYLEKKFGEEFRQYRQRSHRFIGLPVSVKPEGRDADAAARPDLSQV